MKYVEGAPPVVFHFLTQGYRVMETPEELQKWESLMKEKVGSKIIASNLSGSCTESISAGEPDDCDED